MDEPRVRLGDPRVGGLGFVVPNWVTHERLDDEVMAIDLETGAYFALDDAAADAWMLVTRGATIDEMAAVVAARYDTTVDAARADLERFVAELERERLLVPRDPDDKVTVDITGEGAVTLPDLPEPRAYVAPVVNKYDDLEELLRLDPVHDVDEVGWPVPRRD